MNNPTGDIATTYDRYYRQTNYFNYRSWLYRPLINTIVTKARLKKGSAVLDVGCGQGFFSSLFADEEMPTLGIDLSAEGINSANRVYGRNGLHFEVANINSFSCPKPFDCVFSRSCSLYNDPTITTNRTTTDTLLQFVRPGGVLIVDYYTNFCRRKQSNIWRHHSLESFGAHFLPYPDTQVFFSLRLAPIVVRRFAFSKVFTHLDAQFSRILGIGGELIAFVRKPL